MYHKAPFPWKFFWGQFLWLAIGLILTTPIVLWTGMQILGFPTSTPDFIGLCLLFIFLGSFLAAVSVYRVARPIGGLVMRALVVSRKKFGDEFPEDEESEMDLISAELGELSDLSLALSKIRRKLKKRRDQLVHEREEAQALMSSLTDAVVSINSDETLAFFNAKFATHFLTQGSARSGLPISEVFRNPDLLALVRDVLLRGETRSMKLELSLKTDGISRFFTVTISALKEFGPHKTIYGALIVFHDIHELVRATQVRMTFVENASHELRTPLTSIKGFVETLKEDVQSQRFDQAQVFLSIVSRNVDRLIELVNDMLSLSSLENQPLLNLDLVDVDRVSHGVLEHLGVQAGDKNIVIHHTSAAPAFLADEKKIEQVLNNLINNAIKYIPSGGTIWVKWDQTELGEIRLRVADNGPGIPKEHLDRLFERFYRIDKSRSRDAGGTGLGLAIVKHIMGSHGGSIVVESEVGRGAEFTCLFPSRIESPPTIL